MSFANIINVDCKQSFHPKFVPGSPILYLHTAAVSDLQIRSVFQVTD